MKMPLDPGRVYDAMECSYRHGVLDKLMAMQGEALEAVMEEADLNMGDLLNRLDEVGEESVTKLDRLLDRLRAFIRLANNDKLMELVSRVLDVRFVRRMMVKNMKIYVLEVVTGESPRSLRERIQAGLRKALWKAA
jgi:hypothetical protein